MIVGGAGFRDRSGDQFWIGEIWDAYQISKWAVGQVCLKIQRGKCGPQIYIWESSAYRWNLKTWS